MDRNFRSAAGQPPIKSPTGAPCAHTSPVAHCSCPPVASQSTSPPAPCPHLVSLVCSSPPPAEDSGGEGGRVPAGRTGGHGSRRLRGRFLSAAGKARGGAGGGGERGGRGGRAYPHRPVGQEHQLRAPPRPDRHPPSARPAPRPGDAARGRPLPRRPRRPAPRPRRPAAHHPPALNRRKSPDAFSGSRGIPAPTPRAPHRSPRAPVFRYLPIKYQVTSFDNRIGRPERSALQGKPLSEPPPRAHHGPGNGPASDGREGGPETFLEPNPERRLLGGRPSDERGRPGGARAGHAPVEARTIG